MEKNCTFCKITKGEEGVRAKSIFITNFIYDNPAEYLALWAADFTGRIVI